MIMLFLFLICLVGICFFAIDKLVTIIVCIGGFVIFMFVTIIISDEKRRQEQIKQMEKEEKDRYEKELYEKFFNKVYERMKDNNKK